MAALAHPAGPLLCARWICDATDKMHMIVPAAIKEAPHGQSASLVVPELGACTSSGGAWQLWAARHSQEAAGPLGAQPLPRVLERAASKAAHVTTL